MDSVTRRGAWVFYLAGIGWSTIFGLSFLVTKGALGAFSPFELLFLRFGLATAALVVLAVLRVVRLSFGGKGVLPLVPICLFQPILYFACETYGLRETASSTAGLILGALPAAVSALSVPMLKERLSPRAVAGLCVSVAGVALIVVVGSSGASGEAGADSLRGVLLIVGALASAAFYNVYSRRASAVFGPAETTFAMMASGMAFFGLLALAQDLATGREAGFLDAPATAWGAVFYLGLLSSVLAFFLVNLSLSRLKASQASIFGTLVPLVALVAGVAFRGERPGLVELSGAAAIVGGVWMTNAGERRRNSADGRREPEGGKG
jgi:drug/metabolite transporter (DMT)-like permease